jgi:hypothetical protein
MHTKTMILPLDANGELFAMQDDKGNVIGTGTREVCEILVYIISKAASASISRTVPSQPRVNVRSAVTI